MKINSRYEPQIMGNIYLDRLFGKYRFTTDAHDRGISLDYLSSPLAVHINLTDYCNLNCKYCYAFNSEKRKKQFSYDEYLTIIDKLKKNNTFMIYFSGGEPTVHSDFSRMLRHTVDEGFIVVVLSNLVNIDSIDTDLLFNKSVKIQAGLNGIWNDDRENNDYLMKTCENYRYLQLNGASLVATIMIDQNSIDLTKLLRFLDSYNIRNVRFGLLIGEGKMKNLLLTSEYIQYVKSVRNDLLRLQQQYPYMNFSYQNESSVYMPGLFSRRFESCEAGTSEMYIDSDGTVFPCPLFKEYPQFTCGNIFEDSIEKIWNSPVMNLFRSISFSDTQCISCDQLCGVWCRGLVYSYTQNLLAHSPFCVSSDRGSL